MIGIALTYEAVLLVMTRAITAAQFMRPLLATAEVWILHERSAMLLAVNAIRAAKGLQPATMAIIELLESTACGHSDYTYKLAGYCTELSLGLIPRYEKKIKEDEKTPKTA